MFILSVTLSNNKTYLVEVKKNCNAEQTADRFCSENDMSDDIVVKEELTELLRQYIDSFNKQAHLND